MFSRIILIGKKVTRSTFKKPNLRIQVHVDKEEGVTWCVQGTACQLFTFICPHSCEEPQANVLLCVVGIILCATV